MICHSVLLEFCICKLLVACATVMSAHLWPTLYCANTKGFQILHFTLADVKRKPISPAFRKLNMPLCRGIYSYLPVAQLSRHQFWGNTFQKWKFNFET